MSKNVVKISLDCPFKSPGFPDSSEREKQFKNDLFLPAWQKELSQQASAKRPSWLHSWVHPLDQPSHQPFPHSPSVSLLPGLGKGIPAKFKYSKFDCFAIYISVLFLLDTGGSQEFLLKLVDSQFIKFFLEQAWKSYLGPGNSDRLESCVQNSTNYCNLLCVN
jgi:hypothetical protein